MVHSGLRHVTSGIEARVTMVVAAPVGNENLRVGVEETASVIVSVHCECPTTCMPSHRTIEVGECHILVELPGVQHEAEVCIAAIPPDAEDISVSVQTHQVVEIDLIDCLILCSGKVELVSHLVREEEGIVLCCIIAHSCVPLVASGQRSRAALAEIFMTIIIAMIIIFFISLSPIL